MLTGAPDANEKKCKQWRQQNSLVLVDGWKRCENEGGFIRPAKTLRVDANFFEEGEKRVAFPNEYRYVWTGPKSSLLVKLKNACIIPYCNAITKLTDQSENQLKLIFTECSWMLHQSLAGNQPSLDYIFHECHLPSIVLSTNSGRCQPRSKATILKNMVRNWWN